MRALVLVVGVMVGACSTASAEEYCAQLQGAGLDGRFVTVRASEQGGQGFIEGRLLTVKPGILVLQLSGSRAYVNCANIFSLVIAEPVGRTAQPGSLPDTIERVWKAFGD